MNRKSWNPVFNLCMEVKYNYINKFGSINYEKTDGGSCLERWIGELNCEKYIKIFKPLQINQMGTRVLIRYGRFSDVFSGEKDITNANFWYLYDGFYQECRSVVIDLELDEIVIAPFKKFKNLNEGEENQLDTIIEKIKNAKCVEISNKLDGSMQCARWLGNEAIMSGSQAINRENSWRLQDGYDMLIKNEDYIRALKYYDNYTFIFEFISLRDAHVVKYTKEQEGLYLIGLRDVMTGKQLPYSDVLYVANKFHLRVTNLFKKSFDEVLDDIDKYQSHEMEGYVLNIDGHYVKIKMNDYVRIHNVFSKLSSINLVIKSIADNTYDDLLSKIPLEHHDRLTRVANIVFKYIKDTNETVKRYYKIAPKTTKKDFMLWIDTNVPKEVRGYVRNLFLGKQNNYLRHGNKAPYYYKKLKEMGVTDNYLQLFNKEEDN